MLRSHRRPSRPAAAAAPAYDVLAPAPAPRRRRRCSSPPRTASSTPCRRRSSRRRRPWRPRRTCRAGAAAPCAGPAAAAAATTSSSLSAAAAAASRLWRFGRRQRGRRHRSVTTGRHARAAAALGALVGDELPPQIRELRGRQAVRRDGFLRRRRRASAPRRPIDPCLVLELLGAFSSSGAAPPPPGLAPRDLEVVRRAAGHDARRRRAAAAHLAVLS